MSAMMFEQLTEANERAHAFPANKREQLGEDLLMTLQSEVDPDVESEWGQEIQRRLTEVNNGTAKLVPAEEVFAEARRIVGR